MTKRKKRKTPVKRKTSRKKQTGNKKLINILLLIIILLVSAIIFLIYMIDTQKLKKSTQTIPKVVEKIEKNVKNTHDEFDKYFEQIEQIKKDKFEEYTKDFYKEYDEQTEPQVKDVKKDKKIEKDKEEKSNLAIKEKKPKLAIIIDDVTTSYQVKQIQSIGFTTTMSFMPPTPHHNDSAKIAQNLPFYMIHLPMEAKYFKNEEKNTLHTKDSYEKIENRISQIRKWYPNAKFTNNHTGSEFTSNKEAMDKLFRALKKYNFIFVDSRTTGKSVGKQTAQKYNMPYISRNVFLDNEQNFEYIQNQLKKAIAIAKKNGFAIAICHPHSATINTLKKSKNLLKDLDLVYLEDLPLLKK
ncbi:divergent polysaccharide deacetylase [Halarcobacter anaerophilus]|jgi:hypothetical protein|nr:divergent polysaccharide deacetylase [Halarcobacter anaerophilus]